MQRTRRHIEGDVQLNMAAMLDMAFQLLAFFILTYRPAPVEGCIAIRMPPPAPVTKPDTSNAGAPTPSEANALAGMVALQITVTSDKDKNGAISGIRVGEQRPVTDLREFEQQLRALMKASEIPFDQVLLRVSPTLEYENVLKIVEICARNKLTAGDQQTKVSIVELQ
jgi:biopolymer transport protein ExbD